MTSTKPKVIKDFDKLSDVLIEQIKLVYPKGFRHHLIAFTNRDGKKRKGLPFETEDKYYLIRMTEAGADAIVAEDDDYGDDGKLKETSKKRIADKHEDEDFLNDLNSNDDNDLGDSDDLENNLEIDQNAEFDQ